jgi:hypothetical protein
LPRPGRHKDINTIAGPSSAATTTVAGIDTSLSSADHADVKHAVRQVYFSRPAKTRQRSQPPALTTTNNSRAPDAQSSDERAPS